MNNKHCHHGVSFAEHCKKCERIWIDEITLPQFRKSVGDLLKFYDKSTLTGLIEMQSIHIERLQAQVPPIRDNQPRRVREG